MRRYLSFALAATVALSFSDDARADDARGADGLESDLDRIVSAEESGGWFVDRVHFDAMHATVLQSVCRATPEARTAALGRLALAAERAGDPRTLFEREGRLTDRVKTALHASRVRGAFEHALEGVERDCPFWAPPAPGFDGRQSDRHKFTLSAESGGTLQVRRTDGTWTYGAGGGVRLLPGYGFGRVSVLAGFELTGGAMLRPRTEPSQFVVNYFPAVPLILRIHDSSWHYDLEVAGASLFQADDGNFSFGGRVGFGMGISALRTRAFIPWAGAAIAVEHYLESGGRPAADMVRAGLRFGVVWDP